MTISLSRLPGVNPRLLCIYARLSGTYTQLSRGKSHKRPIFCYLDRVGRHKSTEQRGVLQQFAASITNRRGGQQRKDFAAFLGVNVSTLANWEAGDQAPTLDAAVTYANKLGISLAEFTFGRDPQSDLLAQARFEAKELRELLLRVTGGKP